ncbi:DUF1673 family protein [Methanolacinia paynteri]|uniref:DUF1673 family protein n=1 Tax=Methanolacinia paynteri TaxID=230356 RepID=UPI00064FBE5C|nr:DUF1673 family protein [Methanolacinia paynteri]
MTIRISETIHKWMGWCPVKSGITIPAGTEGYETKPGRSPGGPERTGTERIIDYGSSGSSLLNLLMLGAGIAAIVFGIKAVSLFFIGADAIALLCFLFATAFILVYSDLKKTRIETDHENIIIYRPVFRPVIIPKEEISAVEMHDNHRPVLYWFITVFSLVLIPIYSITGIYDRYSSWASGVTSTPGFALYLGFFISITVFFLAIYNSLRIRRRYPETLVIKTTRNKKLVIYGKDHEEIAEFKESLL